jgi:hypothetical protein
MTTFEGADRRGASGRWRAGMVAAVACAAAAAAGCGPMHGGSLGAVGFTSTYGYDIPYEHGTQRLLPADWRLDNFEIGRSGWQRKTSKRYVTNYHLEDDDDRDGRGGTIVDAFKYALRFEHRVHAGVIWLREIPIETKLRSKELRVLMQSYIDELSGGVYETVERGSTSPWEAKPQIVVEHRHAPVVLEDGPAVVAEQPAYTATIELADIDEVHVAPQTRTSRVQLVLMRAPHDETYEPGDINVPTRRYPVILLAGYSNMPQDFAKGLDDFHGLLRRMVIAGKTGLVLEPALAPPGLPPGAPATNADAPPLTAAPSAVPPAP